mmetsp:Transcript_41456/g.84598  ORF Transcript_41456/g.84598 Transcript_41456/m.84598 type:complete len:254 (-) Transcript_41456:100-861(-)
MGLPSPEASFKHHDALLGRAALSEEVGDCRSPMRRILAKKCHNRLVLKLLHVRPDLFQQIHGRDVCRAWNCSACSVLPAQVDHNHILLILLPKRFEIDWVHALDTGVFGNLAINQRELFALWCFHLRGHHLFGKLLLWSHLGRNNLEWKHHLIAASLGALHRMHRGSIHPTQWPGQLRHVHHGRWHRGWRRPRSRPHLSWQLLQLLLPKPRLRWPHMRHMRQHWLLEHGLLQHQAWLHLLHRLHRVHHLHLHG